MIFSKYLRTNPKPSLQSESVFQFLDRCSTDSVAGIRSKLEEWMLCYSPEEQPELCKRIRADFDSVFYELLLHQLFIKQGHTITVHPNAGDKGKRPDFAIESKVNKEKFVLEATCCTDDVECGVSSPRMRQVFDSINAMKCPQYFITIHSVTLKGTDQPSSRRITEFLRKTISTFDPETVLMTKYYHELPEFEYDDNSVTIEFGLIPKKKEFWHCVDTETIGSYSGAARWGDSTDAVRQKLHSKAKSYGSLSVPFVISVNVLSNWGYDVQKVLYGSEVVNRGALSQQDSLINGFWGTSNRPKHKRISAVVLGSVNLFNLSKKSLHLYHNPWAQYPLSDSAWPLANVKNDVGKNVIQNEEVTLGQVLNLPDDWPGELFPRDKEPTG